MCHEFFPGVEHLEGFLYDFELLKLEIRALLTQMWAANPPDLAGPVVGQGFHVDFGAAG